MPESGNLIITSCELCKSRYRVPESILGKIVKCPKCNHRQAVVRENEHKGGLPIVLTIGYMYEILDRELVQKIADLFNQTLKSGRQINIEDFIKEQGLITDDNLQLIKDSEKLWDLRQKEIEFGRILIKQNIIGKESVDRLLRHQVIVFKKSRDILLLGDLLVSGGLLSREKRDEILESQGRKDIRYFFRNHTLIEEKPVHQKPALPDAERNIISDKADIKSNKNINNVITEENAEKSESSSSESHDITDDFEIRFSEDRINAYLVIKNENASITVNDIITAMDRAGVSYGVVDTSLIGGFLKYHKNNQKVFRLAQGSKPDPGRNAVINYNFDTEYLKPGIITEDDQIDFRDRGTIPFCNEGDIIAEKIPLVPSRDGMDAAGCLIQMPKVLDANLIAGTNVVIDETGLKAKALISGQPVLSFGGKLSVLPEIKIKGDVGYQTGHVVFEGNIIIEGAVQNGFRVKGGNITAAEVAGGIIESSGNIAVSGGITDAKIECVGSLSSKFINGSDIHSYGDIIVKNEIIDSTITTSGAVEIKKGSVISSDISAKRGIIAKDIGTETSRPCRIKVGTLDHEKQELRKIENRLEFKIGWARRIEKLIMGLANELKKNQEEQTKMAHIQDRASIEMRTLKTAIAEAGTNQSGADAVRSRISQLETVIKNSEMKVHNLFNDQDVLEMHLKEEPEELKKIRNEIDGIISEKKDFQNWMGNISSVPVLKVEGAITSGTVVSGEGASIVIQNTSRRVRIQEAVINTPLEGNRFEMMIKPL